MRPYKLSILFPSVKPSGSLFEPSSGSLLASARACLSLSILSGSSSGFFPLFCLAATRPLQALYKALFKAFLIETRVRYTSGLFKLARGFLGFLMAKLQLFQYELELFHYCTYPVLYENPVQFDKNAFLRFIDQRPPPPKLFLGIYIFGKVRHCFFDGNLK